MLSFFRRGVTSKIMLGVLALGLFAIVITGFGTGGGGLGGVGATGDTVATAGDEKVTSTDISEQVNRQLASAREQQPELDLATFLRTGIYEQVVDQLITARALFSFGIDMGLGISKRLIDGEIASIPGFQNVAGQFDDTVFRQVLARENITEQQLRREIEQSLVQQQLLGPVGSNALVPQGIALQYASLLLERRTGSVGIVPTQAMPQGAAPTDAEIAAYYNQQKGRYTVPERRVLRYALIGAEQLGAAGVPTEADIQGYYRSNAARYGAQETRNLSRVILPDQNAAQQFAAKLQRGISFNQAAAEAGFGNADTRAENQTKAQFANLTSPGAANAAFSAAEGAVTAPIETELGWMIARVDKINRTTARSLESVRPEIMQVLSQQKRQDGIADLVTRVEDVIADGLTFDEAARQAGLPIKETPPVTAAGAAQGGQLPPEAAPLLKIGFELTEDDEPVVEAIAEGQRYALVDVARIIPAAPPPLAQIKDRVRTDFIAKRAADRARQIANQIVTRINGGMAPAQAFAQAGVQLPPLEAVNARRMDIAQGGQQVPPPLAMMFSMKRGTAKLLEAPNGAGWFVVHLASTQAGDARSNPQLVQQTRQQFTQVTGNEYAEQFARAVEKHVDVERDQDAIAALKRQLMGPGAR